MNISSLYNQNVSSVLANALQANSSTSASPSSGGTGQSPFAQLLSSLQSLEQSNPAQYQQVTKQIATKLQTAAQTAQSTGNASQASELTQLSKDFSSASSSNQLPSIQDLAEAVNGGSAHHHHHSAAHSSAGSSTTSSAGGDTNPMEIIMNSLSNASISVAANNG